MPFTLGILENTGQQTNEKYRQYTKYNSEKANKIKYSKTKLPRLHHLLLYNTRPGNEVGLFYNTSETTQGAAFKCKIC